MMFWKKKEPPPPPPEREPITFRGDDSMHKRAENIWYALGFVNDRMGSIPQIAGYLSMYRDWDNAQPKPKKNRAENAET